MARQTKAQIAAAAEAAVRSRKIAALRWSVDVPVPDVAVPAFGEPEVIGFVYNVYAMRVLHARCTAAYMAIGDDLALLHSNPSWAQTRIPMYSTRARALAALRHAAEHECAVKLDLVDQMIDQINPM